jgi:hypothetical protein
VDGPYRSADGSLNPNAKGLNLGQTDFAMALFKAQDTPDNAVLDLGAPTWLALSATVGQVDLVGVPGLVLSGTDFGIEINQVSGLRSGLSDNDHAIYFKSPMAVRAGAERFLPLDMKGSEGEVLRVRGTVLASVGDVLSFSGSAQFEKKQLDIVLSDGSKLSDADLLIMGGSNMSARLASGGAADALGGGGQAQRVNVARELLAEAAEDAVAVGLTPRAHKRVGDDAQAQGADVARAQARQVAVPEERGVGQGVLGVVAAPVPAQKPRGQQQIAVQVDDERRLVDGLGLGGDAPGEDRV